MKRRLLTLAIFLLLGAVVNVAVAAGIAQFSFQSSSLVYAEVLTILKARVIPGDPGSGLNYQSFLEENVGVTHQGTVLDNGSKMIDGDESIDLQFSVGWPFRSLRAQSHYRNGQWIRDSWLLPLVPRSDIFGFESQPELPLLPIWPGFAINTAFYAALLWLVIPGPFALRRLIRRLIRRKRGLCVACGYDLRGDLARGCPECGWRREAAS